jgi:PAS domain S-box-containing protein
VDTRARQQEAVLAFGRRANARPPLAVLMQDAVALVTDIVDAELNGVGEIESGQTLVLSVSRSGRGGNPAEPAVGRCSLESADSMAAYALKTASPTVSVNLAQESRFNDPFLRGLGARSALCIPLHLNGRPYGALGVYRTEPREFSLDDVCFAETIAHLLSSSIARIKLEEELHEERETKSTVLELVDAMVLALDMDGRVITMNRACEELTKYSLEEVRSRPFWSLFVDRDELELIRGIFRNSKANKIPNQFEGYLIAKDGSRRKVAWSLKVMCTGQVQSLILAGVDQTEHVETKKELQKARSLADRATRALKDLTEKMKDEPARAARRSRSSVAVQPASHAAPPREAEPHPSRPANAKPSAGRTGKEKRSSVRWEYPYRQWVAPIVDGRIPSRRDFFEVQCKDISGGGIAFLVSFPPEFENVVVGLGRSPALTYFVARVMRVARVEYGDGIGYLVGCRFLARATLAKEGRAAAHGE